MCSFDQDLNQLDSNQLFTMSSYKHTRSNWTQYQDCPYSLENGYREYFTKREYCNRFQSCETDNDCLKQCFQYCWQCWGGEQCNIDAHHGNTVSLNEYNCFFPGRGIIGNKIN
ncbi:hypothetical protein CYY_005090 [Polysphondylium violaceum]|uniref:Uncharacterized protein n=1 Tax=Polysphondylium violaceum TaxID=133409 RepID=A0A8J4Q441_9MYCE|nr:hypothetical protein CYY_005090 [Polysphondylium violaceum]